MKKSKRRKKIKGKNLSTIHNRIFLKVRQLLKKGLNEGLKDLPSILVSFFIGKILTNLFKFK